MAVLQNFCFGGEELLVAVKSLPALGRCAARAQAAGPQGSFSTTKGITQTEVIHLLPSGERGSLKAFLQCPVGWKPQQCPTSIGTTAD